MSLELGFFVPPVPQDEFMAMARKAEESGFDFLTVDDHMIYPFGAPFGESPDYYGIHEAWTVMTFLAGATSKISVSHMVLVLSFRGPGMVAKMGATLDLFSQGRMDLTVGAGWFEREFKAFNFPWGSHKERLERLYEAVKIIKALWTEPKVTFEGKYYQLHNAELLPKPFQKPAPPIWIGGDSKRSMNIAAELGDGWLVHGHQPEEIERMFKAIKPSLGARAGNFGLGMAAFLVMGKDRGDATAKVNRIITPEIWERFQMADIKHELNNRISGNPQQCIDQIKAMQKLGMNRLITIFLDPEDVDLFVQEVMPAIR
jgi:FMNH2-dependent dimethyl sulfone monooxygenase